MRREGQRAIEKAYVASAGCLPSLEARPIATIKSEQAVLFFLDIIHRFGVPNSIITDNGTQFTDRKFIRFCDEQHIRIDWAAVAHLKALVWFW